MLFEKNDSVHCDPCWLFACRNHNNYSPECPYFIIISFEIVCLMASKFSYKIL